jgi:hypothetical protein
MKHLLTPFLILALVALPFGSNQAQQPPQPRFTLLEICVVVPILAIMTVGVICYVVHEHNTPWPTNSNQFSNSVPVQPPGTNEYGVFTNSFASLRSVMVLQGPPIVSVDITDQGLCDTNALARPNWTNSVIFTNAFQFTIKAGDSPNRLEPLYIVKGWLSAGGRLIEYDDPQGRLICSSYAYWGSYPQSPPLGTGLERARFMTFVSP